MEYALDVTLSLAARAAKAWLKPHVAGSALAALAALLVAARIRFGPGWWRRVTTPAVRTDATYAAFYLGGIYAFPVSGPAYRLLTKLGETNARRPPVAASALPALAALRAAARIRFGPGWWRRVTTPAVRTDATYAAFYLGGIYAFLVSGPAYRFLTKLVETHAPFLQLGLLAHLPVWSQFFVASVAMDGVLYWSHRALHASPWLWEFQSEHHSQGEMTALANFRFHAADVFVRGLA